MRAITYNINNDDLLQKSNMSACTVFIRLLVVFLRICLRTFKRCVGVYLFFLIPGITFTCSAPELMIRQTFAFIYQVK